MEPLSALGKELVMVCLRVLSPQLMPRLSHVGVGMLEIFTCPVECFNPF